MGVKILNFGDFWAPAGAKIDQKRARDRKSASEDDAGTDFLRFLAPLSFGVGLGTDFWRV